MRRGRPRSSWFTIPSRPARLSSTRAPRSSSATFARSFMRAVLLIPIVLSMATPLRDASPTTQTGTFTTKFTERSPSSAPNELARRFGEKQAIPEYDLSQHEFLIHVPSDYDGSKPMGVVFLLLYKD